MASNISAGKVPSDMIAEQQQSVKTTKAKTVKTKVSKKISTSNQISTQTTSSTTMTSINRNTMEVIENTTASMELKQSSINNANIQEMSPQKDEHESTTPLTPTDDDVVKNKTGKKKTSNSIGQVNGKKKSKKTKKSEAEKENISVCPFEAKMRILYYKSSEKSNSTETTLSIDSTKECCSAEYSSSSDEGKSGQLTLNDYSDVINKEFIFTSIKTNPFILNSITINRKPVSNKKTLNNFCVATKNRQIATNQCDSRSRSKSPPLINSSPPLETRPCLFQRLEDDLANINVKHLKTVYLEAGSSSPSSCKTQNRSINKATKQNRSSTIKNLCRSFGDLSFIGDGESGTYRNYLKRTKSVGDLGNFNSLLKYFKCYGVSVRVLRDSYKKLISLDASGSPVMGGVETANWQKSSFSKFDALQKRNLIHVRSSDAGKAQEKFTDTYAEKKQDCRVCQKQVYKMEEIKAEKSIYHKNCFRCNECEKQLKVDNYQSHEGVLYCKAHFKMLFSPKAVEDTEEDKPRKPELIIRENQPIELPPDVIRASDKPDLGLEELQQINVRSKFEAFEKSHQQTNERPLERVPSTAGVKRSASILSKLAKFQAKCPNTGLTDDDLNNVPYDELTESEEELSDDEGADPDLVRAKRAQRERPVGIGNMNDIKTKFESGHILSKEERREERKQEIQNIRSRLFMGKQARIKEMYQQAVAESEHGITSVGKKSEIDVGDKARSLKEKFENGEIFKEHDEVAKVPEDELEVFESAISKRSRSLFKELDAFAAKNQPAPRNRLNSQEQKNRSSDDQTEVNSISSENVIKHDEKQDDVQIETSDISSKFKFFETYKPVENEKKTFRITPPREGVVKLPSPENESGEELAKQANDDTVSAEKTQTATIMLSKFREMERSKDTVHLGPRPLKCFTPPPDEGRRAYNESDSDMENMSEEEEYEEEGEEEECEDENSEYNGVHVDARSSDHLEDEALIQAQASARAKKLRAKFEKWEANEIQREIQDGTINLYGDNAEENQIESARAIRAKFENMKEFQSNQSTRPRHKVNRFV